MAKRFDGKKKSGLPNVAFGLTFHPVIPLRIKAARSRSSVLLFPVPLTDLIIAVRLGVSPSNFPLLSFARRIFSIGTLGRVVEPLQS
jgi:hypothetical protein